MTYSELHHLVMFKDNAACEDCDSKNRAAMATPLEVEENRDGTCVHKYLFDICCNDCGYPFIREFHKFVTKSPLKDDKLVQAVDTSLQETISDVRNGTSNAATIVDIRNQYSD